MVPIRCSVQDIYLRVSYIMVQIRCSVQDIVDILGVYM